MSDRARILPWLFLLAGIAMNARAAESTPGRAPAEPASAIAANLQAVRGARVFFSHMSIGANILEGLARTAKPLGGLPFTEIAPGRDLRLGNTYFAHSQAGKNGAPLTKLEAFSSRFEQGMSPPPDVALMKFCYVDFYGASDARALFEAYKSTLRTLQRRHPGTVFVHVTAPLVTKGRGWKEAIKRWTGFRDETARANMRRHEYNEMIRNEFRNEVIFDLALHESIRPDGTQETFERRGVAYPSLVPAYATADGQHLNEAGQARLAAAMLSALTEALGRRTR